VLKQAEEDADDARQGRQFFGGEDLKDYAGAISHHAANERDDFVSAIAYEQIIAPGVKRNKDINRISKQQTARYVRDDSLILV